MTDTDFENMDRYLHDDFPALEREAFEERLEKDAEFKEQFRVYSEVYHVLSEHFDRSEEEQALRGKLKQKNQHYFNETSPKKSPKKLWISVISVAAAAIIIFLLWAPWQQNALNQYGQIEMTNPTVRGNEQNERMIRAAQLFNAGDYQKVLPLLDSAVRIKPDNAQNLFYRGVTLLHLNKNEKALQDLQKVFNGTSVYRFEAAYFIGLAYYNSAEKDSCREWLNKIPDDAAVADKAQRLLKKLE
ncbi:MAG TPA: hypothetical protein VK084_11745 [Chitinophagaceae bacterium]|nr:hypothetical protein [Chitinophagaceae bacterium]